MANAFWWQRDGKGLYSIGLGTTICVQVTCPDDALGSQWAQCCATALNQRERELRQQAARDRYEDMIDDARDYGPAE